MVSNERILEMTNIQGSTEGIYTCVATHTLSGATITVNVTVQCKCQLKLGTCMSTDYAPVQNLMYFKLCIVSIITCSMYICIEHLYISFIAKHQCLLLGDGALDAVFCCSVCWYAQSGGAVVRNS